MLVAWYSFFRSNRKPESSYPAPQGSNPIGPLGLIMRGGVLIPQPFGHADARILGEKILCPLLLTASLIGTSDEERVVKSITKIDE